MGLSGSVAESHADLLEKAAWYRGFKIRLLLFSHFSHVRLFQPHGL